MGTRSERGIYKTVDGGKTWKQTLKVDDDTGANEVAMDPSNSLILYAMTNAGGLNAASTAAGPAAASSSRPTAARPGRS